MKISMVLEMIVQKVTYILRLRAVGPSEPFGGPAGGSVSANPVAPTGRAPRWVERPRTLFVPDEAQEFPLRAYPATPDAAAQRNVTSFHPHYARSVSSSLSVSSGLGSGEALKSASKAARLASSVPKDGSVVREATA